MAGLKFSDGTTTVDLSTQFSWNLATGSGRTVTERIFLTFDTGLTARGTVNTLEQFFAQARLAQQPGEEGLPRIYGECRPADTDPWWRFEVVDGTCDVAIEGFNDYELACMVRFAIIVERLNYFEGAEQNMELTAPGMGVTTPTTSPISLTNGVNSYVVVASGINMVGDLDYPVKLRVVNNFASANWLDELYVGLNRGATAWNDLCFLEAEAATPIGGSSTSADAGSSGGTYRTSTWTGSAETQIMDFTLSSSIAQRIRGKAVTPVLRLVGSIHSDLQARLVLRQSLTPQTQTPWVFAGSGAQLVTLAPINIPTRWLGNAAMPALVLSLHVKRPSGGSNSVGVDYLALTGKDGFKRYFSVGVAADQNVAIVEDPYDRVMYADYSGQRVGSFNSVGVKDFVLRTREAAVFTFQHMADNASAAANRTLQVSATFRPRRRSI
jgi:hypothetical protein